MHQIPPPQLPPHGPGLPAGPAVIPILPTRVQQPGRQAPLPDAVAVRRCPVPVTAPPFDADVPPATSKDGNGVVTQAVASTPDLADTTPGPATPDPDKSDVSDSGADETSRAQPGPDGGWPSQFAQVLAETLAGSRPARQLAPWTTEQARKRIQQLGPALATDQRPRVRRVMTSAPAPNVLEMTAVVGFGPRVRVLALRLEREQVRAYRDGGSRWCCTAIESA
jgi:hypothetical protein